MAEYAWPTPDDRKFIGTDVLRVDAPLKVSGKAQYTTDVNLPGMLYAATVRCPFAHAKIVSIDTKAAAKSASAMPAYVPQRHRFPHIPRLMSSRVGAGFSFRKALADITNPDVQ